MHYVRIGFLRGGSSWDWEGFKDAVLNERPGWLWACSKLVWAKTVRFLYACCAF